MQVITSFANNVIPHEIQVTADSNEATYGVLLRVDVLRNGPMELMLEQLYKEAAVALDAKHTLQGEYYHAITDMFRVDLFGAKVPNDGKSWARVSVSAETDWENLNLLKVWLTEGADQDGLDELEGVVIQLKRVPGRALVGQTTSNEDVRNNVAVESTAVDPSGDSAFVLSVTTAALRSGVDIDLNQITHQALLAVRDDDEHEDNAYVDIDRPSIIGWGTTHHAMMPNFQAIPAVEGQPDTVIPLRAHIAPDTHILSIQPIDELLDMSLYNGVYIFIERLVTHLAAPAVATEQLSSTL